MFENNAFFEKELIREVEAILDDIGLDMQTVTRITLKRIARERSAAFLLAGGSASEPQQAAKSAGKEKDAAIQPDGRVKMTKNKAVALFRQKGITLSRNTTFSSKNNSTHIYWANPNFQVLKSDWNLILNDWVHRQLHLFIIPANKIAASSLVGRADSPDLIDLQIAPDDPTYTDNRSKMSFCNYFIKTVTY